MKIISHTDVDFKISFGTLLRSKKHSVNTLDQNLKPYHHVFGLFKLAGRLPLHSSVKTDFTSSFATLIPKSQLSSEKS